MNKVHIYIYIYYDIKKNRYGDLDIIYIYIFRYVDLYVYALPHWRSFRTPAFCFVCFTLVWPRPLDLNVNELYLLQGTTAQFQNDDPSSVQSLDMMAWDSQKVVLGWLYIWVS